MGTGSEAAAPHMASPRRRWMITALLAVVILLCGMVIGGGLTLHLAWQRIQYNVRHPDVFTERIVNTMDRRLDLDGDQEARVLEAVRRRQQALKAIRIEVQPRVEAELDTLREEVSAVLNEEQRVRWVTFFDQLRAKLLPPVPDAD